MGSERTGRHFTVSVFVVWEGKVLLHFHRKLGMWLPPGGHIERDELPDDAALREVYEETGLRVALVGERRDDVADPVQLHRPAGGAGGGEARARRGSGPAPPAGGVTAGEPGAGAPAHRLYLLRQARRSHRHPPRLQRGQGRMVRPRRLGWDALER